MIKKIIFLALASVIIFSSISILAIDEYDEYQRRIEAVKFEEDIILNGFDIITKQRYPVVHQTLGALEFIPTIDRNYGRVVLFFKNQDQEIVFKTDKLESNIWIPEQLRQPNIDISGVSFRDLNEDGLSDIIIVCGCINTEGDYAGKPYNVGDVLFQNNKGFYRDWRIADKINRFDMNKNTYATTVFVRYGKSTEFLYTSKTLEELLDGGYEIINAHSFTAYFEKFGVVQVISGFYNLSGQNFLIIYIIDEKGNIVWNFQPMGDYVNFYDTKGLSFNDIDGDGLKDVTVLANYVKYDAEGKAKIVADYNVYYQRTGFFLEDTDIKRRYVCNAEDTIDTVVLNVKRFWGGVND